MELTAYQKAELWGRIKVIAARLLKAVKRQNCTDAKEAYTRLGELIARMDVAEQVAD